MDLFRGVVNAMTGNSNADRRGSTRSTSTSSGHPGSSASSSSASSSGSSSSRGHRGGSTTGVQLHGGTSSRTFRISSLASSRQRDDTSDSESDEDEDAGGGLSTYSRATGLIVAATEGFLGLNTRVAVARAAHLSAEKKLLKRSMVVTDAVDKTIVNITDTRTNQALRQHVVRDVSGLSTTTDNNKMIRESFYAWLGTTGSDPNAPLSVHRHPIWAMPHISDTEVAIYCRSGQAATNLGLVLIFEQNPLAVWIITVGQLNVLFPVTLHADVLRSQTNGVWKAWRMDRDGVLYQNLDAGTTWALPSAVLPQEETRTRRERQVSVAASSTTGNGLHRHRTLWSLVEKEEALLSPYEDDERNEFECIKQALARYFGTYGDGPPSQRRNSIQELENRYARVVAQMVRRGSIQISLAAQQAATGVIGRSNGVEYTCVPDAVFGALQARPAVLRHTLTETRRAMQVGDGSIAPNLFRASCWLRSKYSLELRGTEYASSLVKLYGMDLGEYFLSVDISVVVDGVLQTDKHVVLFVAGRHHPAFSKLRGYLQDNTPGSRLLYLEDSDRTSEEAAQNVLYRMYEPLRVRSVSVVRVDELGAVGEVEAARKAAANRKKRQRKKAKVAAGVTGAGNCTT
mmetsp:Transcript_12177/g.32883  ORF Transcript_12177/g.32883 Transcript_12177/m.32883 type:complete len:628 (-) Transcript_12177:262-2145(-)